VIINVQFIIMNNSHKKKNQKDDLLTSFSGFTLDTAEGVTIFGGATSGSSSDPDGCTAVWVDIPGESGYCHMYDQTTEG
jgi:hypothetical protein